MRVLVLLSALLAAVSAGHPSPLRAYSSGSHAHGYGYSLPSGHVRFSSPSKPVHHHAKVHVAPVKVHHYTPQLTQYVHKPVVKTVQVPKVIYKTVEVPQVVVKHVPKVVYKTVEVPQVMVKYVPVAHEVRVAAPVHAPAVYAQAVAAPAPAVYAQTVAAPAPAVYA